VDRAGSPPVPASDRASASVARSAATARQPRLRLELERNDFVTVLWSLEASIEDAKYHGGLETVEDEMRLHERMNAQLRRFDLGRR
jgi:hypothetical protein